MNSEYFCECLLMMSTNWTRLEIGDYRRFGGFTRYLRANAFFADKDAQRIGELALWPTF